MIKKIEHIAMATQLSVGSPGLAPMLGPISFARKQGTLLHQFLRRVLPQNTRCHGCECILEKGQYGICQTCGML